MLFHFSGIPVEVRKKNIKNLHLYVKPPGGDVLVSAPLSMSDAEIERFVRTKLGWIQKQIARFEAHPRPPKQEYCPGETLLLWGEPYTLAVEHGGKNSLTLSAGGRAILTVREGSTVEQRTRFVREWYRERLKEEIARRLPEWETATGLQASGWQTKDMKTRWGTCNTGTKKIWLNLQLAKRAPECLDYVILHELAHLVERRHDKRFYALMDRYMPEWRRVRRKLNEQVPR